MAYPDASSENPRQTSAAVTEVPEPPPREKGWIADRGTATWSVSEGAASARSTPAFSKGEDGYQSWLAPSRLEGYN